MTDELRQRIRLRLLGLVERIDAELRSLENADELTAAERNVVEAAERWHDGCSAADVDALVDAVVRLRGVRG